MSQKSYCRLAIGMAFCALHVREWQRLRITTSYGAQAKNASTESWQSFLLRQFAWTKARRLDSFPLFFPGRLTLHSVLDDSRTLLHTISSLHTCSSLLSLCLILCLFVLSSAMLSLYNKAVSLHSILCAECYETGLPDIFLPWSIYRQQLRRYSQTASPDSSR